MQYFHKDYLKYTIPDEWIAEEREDVLTIYSPAGEGAMTLSFYSLVNFEQDIVTRISDMASQFVNQNKIALSDKIMRVHVSKDNKALLHCEGKMPDGWFTKLWIVAKGSKIILATYDAKEENEEVSVCDAIIDSMAFIL